MRRHRLIRHFQRDEGSGRLFLDPGHHQREEAEAFLLVFLEWVTLAVAAETDAVFQGVHAEEMVFPGFVDDLQGLPADQIAKIMGGNLARLMNVAA